MYIIIAKGGSCFNVCLSQLIYSYLNYNGEQVTVTQVSVASDTLFTVHLHGNALQLKMGYIDDYPVWVEDKGLVTKRSEEIGRLIEEYDGR